MVGLGVFLGWLLWGREPPPPEIITETKTDTLERVDTVRWVPPHLTAQIKALQGAIAGFLADTTFKPDTTCIRLLAEAGVTLDSLKRALATRPSITLSLANTFDFTHPVKALWVGVSYRAEGDSAEVQWSDSQFTAPLVPKSRFGAVFGYGAGAGGFAGAQVRLDQSKMIQAAKSEKGWQAGLVWFVK